MRLGFALLITANVLFGLSGCAREEPDTAAQQQTTTPAAEPTQLAVEMWLDDFELGAGGQASAAAKPSDDAFKPGEPVQLSMSVQDAPQDVAVTTYWYGPEDRPLSYETKQVAPNAERLTFTHDNTHDWAPGTYRAEVWVGDEKVNEQQFQIIAG